MTNSELLQNIIDASGMTDKFICERMDWSRNTLKAKINNASEFTVPEMLQMVNLLNMNRETMEAVFYA